MAHTSLIGIGVSTRRLRTKTFVFCSFYNTGRWTKSKKPSDSEI
jgi:hypothetical protein